MKNRSLTSHLNFASISLFGFIIILIFLSTYFLHLNIIKKQELDNLKIYCNQINNILNLDFELNNNSKTLPTQNDWKNQLLFILNPTEEGSLMIFNGNMQSIAYSIKSRNETTKEQLIKGEWLVNFNKSFVDNNPIYKKFKIGKETFNSFTLKNEKLNIYVSVIHPYFRYIRSPDLFIKTLLVGFILVFLLTTLLIKLTNSKQTRSINELVSNLKNSKYLKYNISKKEDETEIIRKYIGLLENQIILNEKKNEKIKTSNINLENDLKLARKIQRNLLPSITPSDTIHKEFEICAFSESAFEIGGDLFDYFYIDDNHLFLTVADVAGKGIPASLYMIYTHTLLRSITKPGLSVTDIIESLNNKLIEENISDMFVTIFVGILNINTGEFIYCNAAQNFPCLITGKGEVIELSESHGIPIGIYPDRKYKSTTILLKDGDLVFIYTDGLTDTVDENGLKYTTDVLKFNLMGTWFFSSNEVVDKIKNSVENFRGTLPPVDDMTILILKYTL